MILQVSWTTDAGMDRVEIFDSWREDLERQNRGRTQNEKNY